MKKSAIAILAAAGVAAFAVPALSGCSADMGYELKTDSEGNHYYSVSVSGFSSSLDGEIDIPEYYGEGDERYPVKEIAEQGFAGAYVSKITVPSTVERIGTAAFMYCKNLTEIKFADGIDLAEIGWGAFGGCTMLGEIDLPASVKVVDGMAFYGCERLKTVTLPEGLENINQRAFEDCFALDGVIFPQNIVHIGSRAFYNCSSLSSVILPDSLRDTLTDSLDDDGNPVKDEDGNTVQLTIPAVGWGAFHSCTALKTAVLGANITTVESGTFGYCTALETIYLPAGLKSVAGAYFENGEFVLGHAFHSDVSLKNIYFAGDQSQWAAIEVENTPYKVQGETSDNSAFLNATVTCSVNYGG